jgi:hypothetical protein
MSSYQQDQARDNHGRFASGGAGKSQNRAERVQLGKQLDARKAGQHAWDRPTQNVDQMTKVMHGLQNEYGDKAPSESQVRFMMETGAHTAGVHAATMGKTLAQTSAAGATTAKVGGNQS